MTLALIVGLWSAAEAGGQTWAALTDSTDNAGNQFEAGTVELQDNDGETMPMFTFTNQRPGVIDTSCITVTYTGSLSATVQMYATVSGTLGPYLDLEVTRGSDPSPGFDDCTGFLPDAIDYTGHGNGVLFSDALSAFPTDYATGVADPMAGWPQGASATYRFTVQIADNDAAQGLVSGASFTWEAHS